VLYFSHADSHIVTILVVDWSPLVLNGAIFRKGKILEQSVDITPAKPDKSHETDVA
jgi:hypothetical protein